MAAPRYGGRKCLLWIKGRGQPEARASGRIQSEQDPEPGHGKRGRRRKEPRSKRSGG